MLQSLSMKTFSKEPAPDEVRDRVFCPVCGSASVRPLWDLGSFSFQRCTGCGHVYQNPRPVAEHLSRRYDGEYRDYEVENAGNFFNLMKLGLNDVGFSRIEASLTGEKRFLDVGCATGSLVAHVRDRGWIAEGVEVCEEAAVYGREKRGVTIHTGTLESLALPDNHVDVVHASHVIEHVPDPDRFAAEIYRILKPGGWFICVTPNTASFQARCLKAAWRSAIADHVHLFSVSHLSRLLRQAGFGILRRKTWGGIPQGMAPAPVKLIADRLAKCFGFGDVQIQLARKAL